MNKIKLHIEQADNGIVIGDRTDCKEDEPSTILEVALDKDICYTIGRWIWGEVKAQMDADSANAADLSVIINSTEYRI